jgi:hypothetical protein
MIPRERARWYVLLPLVGVTTSGLIAARAPESPKRCQSQQLIAWVKDHRSELPTTYGEIIRYPTTYRKFIQAYLPWTVRQQLWRTQYHLYRESGLLTSQQQAFLVRAEQVLPELLGENTTAMRREAVADSTTAEAVKVLGRSLTHRILYVLGPDDGPEALQQQVSLFKLAGSARPVNVPNLFVPCTCHASQQEQPECGKPLCQSSTCDGTSSGCGDGGSLACTGLCS